MDEDKQRLAIVSGGGTGIGLAVARALALAEYQIVLLGRREGVLADAAQHLNDEIGVERVSYRPVDLTRPEQVQRVADGLKSPVDVLVNNAGGVAHGPEGTLDEVAALWEADFQGNVLTAVLLTAALLPLLRRPGGRIVTISSIAAVQAGGGSYGAAKAALIPWTYSLAAELGPEGITANVLAPGYIEGTEFFGNRITPERHQRLVDRSLVGRAGVPDDVAASARYLASPEAAFVTGQVLHVNGGVFFGR